MTFPASPSNGQLVTVNSIVYQYSSSNNRWTRTLTPFGNLTITGNTTSNYLISTVITSPAGTGANIIVRPDGLGNVVIGSPAILYVANNSANAVAVAGGVGIGGTVFAGNIVTTGATTTGNLITTTGIFWANGVSALSPAFGNTNTAAYLPTYTGNVSAGNLVAASGVYSSAYFYANGTPFSSSSYGNTNVGNYLPTYSGNVAATGITADTTVYGNLTVTGNVVAANTMIYRGSDQNNWNTLTLMGTYLVNRSSWSGTTGTPLNSLDFIGTLEVLNSGTVIVQNYRPYDTSATPSLFWTRSQFNGSAWTTWTEIIDGAEAVDGGSF